MSLRCPVCGREFDVTLFEYGRSVSCPCGEVLSLADGHVLRGGGDGPPAGAGPPEGGDAAAWDALEREIFQAVDREFDRRRAERFRREADRIAAMILYERMPRIDIEIAIRNFRGRVLASFPEKEELFTALYIGRFRRLWRQFRDDESELLPDETP